VSRHAALGLMGAVLLVAACAQAPTVDQRGVVYQAGILAAQANCVALLSDEEVPRTPAVEEWCVLVLQGRDGCKAP
jgi:hypothetical protein